jgi:antitoxin VapB
MTLNVKNKEAYELAKAISDVTGESLTRVVIEALRTRLEQVERQKRRPPGALAAELMAIGKRAAELSKGRPYVDHAEYLYDEHGLPK